MSTEPKGFYSDSGEILEREKSISTKNGIILYKGKGRVDVWLRRLSFLIS
jgi:hypothetical protein